MSTTSKTEYIEYYPRSKKPIPVGVVVSENLNFETKWQQPDTATRCHENAFLMYDEIRRKEDEFITSASKQPGLAIRYYDGSSKPGVDDFRSDTFQVSSIPVMTDGEKSFELSGFFVPDETAYYSFSFQQGITGRIWVGDEACYEFKTDNQYRTKKLYKNRYYAVRFQYINTGASSSGKIEIIVKKNGIPTTPNFQTVKSQDGTQFIRNLMYYGLVESNIKGKFLFYFNNGKHYSEIQDAKHKNLIIRSRQISYKATNSNRQSYTADENKKLRIEMNSPIYTSQIISATYGPKNRQRNCSDMNVKQQLTDIASKNNGIISIGPGYKDFNSAYKDNPCPGKFKTTRVTVETTINENMLKNRRIILNNKCQLVVDYNDPNSTSPDPLLMFPIASNGVACNEGSSLVIRDDGTVTLNGKNWIVPTKYERDNAKENKRWIPNTTLTRGNELTTLVSANRKYKLKVSRDTGKISFKIGINPSIQDSGEVFTRRNAVNPSSYYLYRPNYSELGGRKYMVDSLDNSITLIPSNSELLKLTPTNYSSVVGYPISDTYVKYKGETFNTCREKCNLSRDCGNYFYTSKNGQCWIDVSANTRPIYNTKPNGSDEKNPPSIYIANRNMKLNNYSFIKNPADEYTGYTIKPDTVATQAVSNTTSNGYSAAILRNSRLETSVSGLKKETEGFSDIPERYLTQLPLAPDTSVEEGRISDLQAIIYQQNVLYSLSSIAALSFLAGAIVLARN